MPGKGRIVVFGASGNVGLPCIKALSASLAKEASPAFDVHAVSRNPPVLEEKLGGGLPGVEIVQGDILDGASLSKVLAGADRFFFCLPSHLPGSEMRAHSNAVADAAVACGVRHCVRLSSLNMGAQGALGEAHEAGEAYMKEKGLTVTSVRPTSFSTNFGFMRADVLERSHFSLLSKGAVNWVATEDIAAVSARALLDASLDGRTLDVTGPPDSTLTPEGMQKLLSEKMGRDIVYQPSPSPPPADWGELAAFLDKGGFDVSTGTVKEVTGRDPISFGAHLDTALK